MHGVTLVLEFDAAHRIVGHMGKCRFLHGHGYKTIIQIASPKLDHLGMVIDFAEVKGRIKKWIDKNWDHNTILNHDDNILELGRTMKKTRIWENEFAMFDVDDGGKAPYVMECNPTAENMAKELANVIQGMIEDYVDWKDLILRSVSIQETTGCFGTYEPELKGGGGGDGEGDSGSDEDEDEEDAEEEGDDGGDDSADGEDADEEDEDEEEEVEKKEEKKGKKTEFEGAGKEVEEEGGDRPWRKNAKRIT